MILWKNIFLSHPVVLFASLLIQSRRLSLKNRELCEKFRFRNISLKYYESSREHRRLQQPQLSAIRCRPAVFSRIDLATNRVLVFVSMLCREAQESIWLRWTDIKLAPLRRRHRLRKGNKNSSKRRISRCSLMCDKTMVDRRKSFCESEKILGDENPQ